MTHETPEQFSTLANQLLRLACPTNEDTPFFNTQMAKAKSLSLTWIEGLEYVIQCRRGMPN